MRRRLGVLAATLAVALSAAGCGAATPSGGAATPSGGAATPSGGHRHQGPAGQSRGAGRSMGTVTGRLEREGGPISPKHLRPAIVPLPGSVIFTRNGKRAAHVHVGDSGTFSVRLPAGTYYAVGRSPKIVQVSNGAVIGASGQLISGSERQAVCSAPSRVVVTPRHTVSVVVACIVP